MRQAAADMNTLELHSQGTLSRRARQAAYGCACSLMVASQSETKFYKKHLLEKLGA